jgi:hypothetical protein
MNVRLEYTFHFTAGVHWGGKLIMNGYRLGVYMVTNTADSESTTIAFERLKHFINEQIESSVFINSEEQEACRLYTAAGIKITTLPREPVDQIVGVMLFHKLNAIMEGRIAVVETELSSLLGDNMVYLHSENETAEDITIPVWWNTPDLTHFDLEFKDGNQVFTLHPGNYSAWADLELDWLDREIVAPGETGNIVFADFGKDDTK